MFNKGLLGDEVAKCRGSDEEVISSFDFTNSGFACCVRHGECERVRMFVKKLLDKCSFTDARRSRNDDRSAITRRCCGRLVASLIFISYTQGSLGTMF